MCEFEYECMFITPAPRCEVSYVSVRNQAECSSSRTSHKYVCTSKRSFKGCNVVRLKVEEEGDRRLKTLDKPPRCATLLLNLCIIMLEVSSLFKSLLFIFFLSLFFCFSIFII